METFIIYLLKVSIATILFYGLHILFLKNETFLKLRRIYFLLALVFSLSFPFLSFDWAVSDKSELPLPAYVMSEIEVFVEEQKMTVPASDAPYTIPLSQVLIGIVVLGVSFLSIRFLTQLVGLFVQLKKLQAKKINGCNIIVVDGATIPSFSFFHWIVINTQNTSDKQIQDIICHEEAHAKQLHSLDIVFGEIFCILFWWNPFVWLIKNEMKLNLEYLADDVVQKNKSDLKDYQYTLLQISTANTGVAFINNFNVLHLKKRITMMNKKKSSAVYSAKYLLVLPLVLALALGNVVYASPEVNEDELTKATNGLYLQDTTKTSKQQAFAVAEQMAEFPGGEAGMMKYLVENLRYPEEAQEAGAQGRVVVRFVVTETGEIDDVEAVRNDVEFENKLEEVVVVAYAKGGEKTEKTVLLSDAKKLLEEEAMRAIKEMPTWNPGMQKGKTVPVYFTLPLSFKLKK